MKLSKKIIAVVLSVLMVVCALPMTVFAADTTQSETSVAKLYVSGTTTYYDTVQEAFDAIPSTASYAYVTLLADVTEGIKVTNAATTTTYFYLNNHTITSDATATIRWDNAARLIMNQAGTVENTSNSLDSGIAVWCRQGNISLQGGTFINNSEYESTVYVGAGTATSSNLTITGGTYINNASNYHWTTGSTKGINTNVWNSFENASNTYLTVKGGTFSADPAVGDDKKGDTFVAEGYESVDNGDDTFTVQKMAVKNTTTNAYYSTVQAAVDAAAENDTLELQRNTSIDTAVVVKTPITLKLGSYTITSAQSGFEFYANCTINATSGGVKAGVNNDGSWTAVTVRPNYSLTINGGKYWVGTDETNAGNSCINNRGNGDVTITGGTFETATHWKNFYYVLNVTQTSGAAGTFIVKGGNFVNYDPTVGDDALGGNFVADGYKSIKSSATTYTVSPETTAYPFEVTDTNSNVFYSTYLNTTSGYTNKLIADYKTSSYIWVNNDVTLDLNGYTYESTNSYSAYLPYATSKLTICDSSANGTGKFANTNADGEGILAYRGEVVVNGGEISGYWYGIVDNGSKSLGPVTITVNGGTVKSTCTEDGAGIYHPQKGTLTVNGGTVTGATGIYAKSGNVVITGGTIEGTGAAVAFDHNSSGMYATGDALVLEACNYPGGVVTASVTGGTFTSANAKAVAVYATKGYEDQAPTAFITGGSFSSDVTTPGYMAEINKVEDADNTVNLTVADQADANIQLDVDAYVDKGLIDSIDDAKVELTYNHNATGTTPEVKTDVVAVSSVEKIDGKYQFTIESAPAQVADKFSIVLKNENNEVVYSNIGYSMKEYCEASIAAGSNVELCKSLLDYAAAAQTYFGYNTGDMATTEDKQDVDGVTVESIKSKAVAGIKEGATGFSVTGTSLVVISKATVRFYVPETLNATDYDLAVNWNAPKGGENIDAYFGTDGEGNYYIAVKGIESSNLDTAFTVTVTNKKDDTVTAINYNAMAYCYSVVKAGADTDLVKLGKAISLYNDAANNTFEQA